MGHKFAAIAFTPSVRRAQEKYGSRSGCARVETDVTKNDRLGAEEIAFISARDTFYMATVGETGWPYVQHRGGPRGFVRVLDEETIAFPDFRGNRQYVSVGNVTSDDRVSLFMMDYANAVRLKIFGRARIVDPRDPLVAEQLRVPGYRAVVERGIVVTIAAFDWNCRLHITPRLSHTELKAESLALLRRIADLEERLEKCLAPPK